MAGYNFKNDIRFYIVEPTREEPDLVTGPNLTSSWIALSNNTIEQTPEGVKCTYVDDTAGMKFYLNDTNNPSGFSGELEVGKSYKVSFESKYEGGDGASIRIRFGLSPSVVIPVTTDLAYYSTTITPVDVDLILQFINMSPTLGPGEFVWVKDLKVEEVIPEKQHEICVGEVTMSQTFTVQNYAVKTIHQQELMFAKSVVNKANPANFDFTLPLIKESDHQILFTLALDYDNTSPYRKILKTFDIYVATKQDVFKVEYCAMEAVTFEVEKDKVLSLNVTGTGSKLSKVGTVDTFVIPGTPQPITANPTYLTAQKIFIALDSVDIPKSIYKFSAELQNNIEWIGYSTVNDALDAVDSDTSMYPAQFVLNDRVFAGSIGMYIEEGNDNNLQDWATEVPITVQAGVQEGGTVYGFEFIMSSCSYTNRLRFGSAFTQHYEWRMTQSPTALSDVIKLITI